MAQLSKLEDTTTTYEDTSNSTALNGNYYANGVNSVGVGGGMNTNTPGSNGMGGGGGLSSILPDLSVLIDAAMSETEGLKEELGLEQEELNKNSNNSSTNGVLSMDVEITSSTTTTTTTTTNNDINMTISSSNDTVDFNITTLKQENSTVLENSVISSPIVVQQNSSSSPPQQSPQSPTQSNTTINPNTSTFGIPSPTLTPSSTVAEDKLSTAILNNNIFNSKLSLSTSSIHGANPHNGNGGYLSSSTPTPSTTYKDYEISKLPLRKRHLVPDNFYYNVYQHVCISPQSPTAKPPTMASSLASAGKSSFSQFEHEHTTTIKQEPVSHNNEQRVPSPSQTNSKLISITENNEFLKNSTFYNNSNRSITDNDDDIDIEGVDDETITVNKKIKKEHNSHSNGNGHHSNGHHSNNHNSSIHPKKKVIDSHNNNSNGNHSSNPNTKPKLNYQPKIISPILDDDEIIIESPPKLKNGSTHSSSHIAPLELSKSQDDDEIDILDDDDHPKKVESNSNRHNRSNHKKPALVKPSSQHNSTNNSNNTNNNGNTSNNNSTNNSNNHSHSHQEENLTIHHSRENIKIEKHDPSKSHQKQKDNHPSKKNEKKRPINRISTKDNNNSNGISSTPKLKKPKVKDSNKRIKLSEPGKEAGNLSDKETDSDSSMSSHSSDSSDSSSDSDSGSGSSSGSSSEAGSQKNRLYCLCKRKYDPKQFMIACDKCDEWYHGECVNISEKDAKRIKSYICIKCKRKEKISQLSINVNNNNSSSGSNNLNSSNNNTKVLNSPKLSPTTSANIQKENNISDKKRMNGSSSQILSSPISPSLSSSSKNNQQKENHHHHHISPINTSPIISSPSSPTLNNTSFDQNHNTTSGGTTANNHKCKVLKCNRTSLPNSKYCSKECSAASANEFLSKNPNLQKELLSTATNSSSNGTNTTIPHNISPPTPTATTPTSADTQKLLSTVNEDNEKLKGIIVKRQEVEGKLKKLEKKTTDFEKLIHQTKLKIESNPSFFLNQSQQPPTSTNSDSNVKIDTMYNNNSNISTPINNNNNNNILTSSTSNILSSPISPSTQINSICIYPMKESTTGFCGAIRCQVHNGWEKKRKDLFQREHNFHTKTLRDLSLEEKQIHQRIARRNKITQQNHNNNSNNQTILNNNNSSTTTSFSRDSQLEV